MSYELPFGFLKNFRTLMIFFKLIDTFTVYEVIFIEFFYWS